MTVTHGTAWTSMQNAAQRALRQERAREMKNYRRPSLKRIDPEILELSRLKRIRLGIGDANGEIVQKTLIRRNGAKRPVTLAGVQPAIIDELEEAELRMVERAKKAVEMLCFGIDEINTAQSDRPRKAIYKSELNLAYLIDVVQKLCVAARIPVPEFQAKRREIKRSFGVCLDCNATLYEYKQDSLCDDCRPVDQAKRDSEVRRAREAELKDLKAQAKRFSQSLTAIRRKINGNSQGHGGHSEPDAEAMDAGGSEEGQHD